MYLKDQRLQRLWGSTKDPKNLLSRTDIELTWASQSAYFGQSRWVLPCRSVCIELSGLWIVIVSVSGPRRSSCCRWPVCPAPLQCAKTCRGEILISAWFGNKNVAKNSKSLERVWSKIFFKKPLEKWVLLSQAFSLTFSLSCLLSLSLSDGRLCHFVRFALHKSIGGLSYPRCPKLLQESFIVIINQPSLCPVLGYYIIFSTNHEKRATYCFALERAVGRHSKLRYYHLWFNTRTYLKVLKLNNEQPS